MTNRLAASHPAMVRILDVGDQPMQMKTPNQNTSVPAGVRSPADTTTDMGLTGPAAILEGTTTMTAVTEQTAEILDDLEPTTGEGETIATEMTTTTMTAALATADRARTAAVQTLTACWKRARRTGRRWNPLPNPCLRSWRNST